MVLTERERTELHAAVVEYLEKQRLPEIASQLTEALAARAPSTFRDEGGALERRWSMLRRLSAANQQLEERCRQLQADVAELQDPTRRAATTARKDCIPREPAVATFPGHRDALTAVAFHPHEPVVYSASEDGSLRGWDLEGRIATFTARHAGAVADIAVEPTKGALLAAACNDHAVRLYQDGRCARTLHGHGAPVSAVAWAGDEGFTLYSADREGDVRGWDAVRGAQLFSLRAAAWVRSLSAGLEVLAVGTNDGCTELWSTAGQRHRTRTLGGFENVVQAVALSSAEADAVIIAAHGTASQKASLKAAQKAAGSSPARGGLFVASGSRDKNVAVHEVATGACVLRIEAHQNWVRGVAFSGNGRHLLTCSDDSTVRAFDLATGKAAAVLTAHENFATCLALHPGGAPLLATGSADNTLKPMTVDYNDFLGLAGKAISVPDTAHISVSLLELSQRLKAKATLWGRIEGYNGDYYVAHASTEPDAAAAAFDVCGRLRFFSADGGLTWQPLKLEAELSGEQKEYCEQIRGKFMGRPEYEYKIQKELPPEEDAPAQTPATEEMPEEDEAEEHPEEGEEDAAEDDAAEEEGEEDEERPVAPKRPKFRIIAIAESIRLAHFVAVHDAACTLVPRGMFMRDTSSGAVVRNRAFPGLDALAARELKNYFHLVVPAPESPESDDAAHVQTDAPDEEAPVDPAVAEAAKEAAAAEAKQEAERLVLQRNADIFGADFNRCWDFLASAVDDVPLGIWSLKQDPGMGIAVLQNLYYPGSVFYHKLGTAHFGQLYVGTGERALDLCFTLP